MLAILDDTHPGVTPDENPIGHMFQTVWHRFQEVRERVGALLHYRQSRLTMIGSCYLQMRPSPGASHYSPISNFPFSIQNISWTCNHPES